MRTSQRIAEQVPALLLDALQGHPADTGPRQETQHCLVLPAPLLLEAGQPSATANKGRQPCCGKQREIIVLAGRLSAFGELMHS